MAEITQRDGERLIPETFKNRNDYLAFLKHLFAYEHLGNLAKKSDRALEIGFGTGYGTRHASKFFSHINAIEVDIETVNFAKEKFSSSSITYDSFDGKSIPFPDNSFDLVYSFQVIEHVQKDLEFLREAKRVLKPNGILFISTPNRNYRLKPGEKPKNRFHIREYSEIDLDQIVKKVFTKFELTGLFGKGEVHQIEINRVKQGLGHLDPIGLRHLMPAKLKQKLKKVINVVSGKKIMPDTEKSNFMSKYSTQDYFISQENIAGSLDLYVIATKES
jgi:ubiquinone/menaquinone biosynthesis C-methylase UbiE